MYHKIGSRPAGVRIKGLYVSVRLLKEQLRELAEEGFKTPEYGQLPAKGSKGATIALSFDDGFQSVHEKAMGPLAEHGFRAIQFLVVNYLGQFNKWETQLGEVREPLMNVTQVKEWLAAGHEIGAHSLSHPFLTRVSLREAREEIFSSKHKLEDLFGTAIKHFCYPYGDWSETIRDLVREAGYATACTTNFGVNTLETPPWELQRITARHQSISIKAIKARLQK
jgi:peptidoglycan/xylan/chitin deacetylase (PgdA/CDA1 family)